MTITYSLDVANTEFCGFTKLLGRWKGSIYKILWKEFLVFISGYAFLSIAYRYFLNANQRRTFESVVLYFESFVDLIPLSFVLGFYVSLVIGRWWEQYDAIPWPDRLCYMISTYVHGADERSRIIRRTLGRYLILMQAFSFQGVSTAVKKRFPTTRHFVAAGFMTKEERTVFENVDVPYGKWWLSAQWFCALAMRARKEGRIKDSVLLNGLIEEFLKYRTTCGKMFNYDWISVPLVYTQVVTLATYTYSVALIVGRQYLDPSLNLNNHKVDLYIPLFTLLQFFFYVGWLKVAEQIVNPYGEDDDDFELNWVLDRSCQVVYLLVDHLHTKHPKLRKDVFWDEMLPQLPQTKITAKNITNPQLGSAFNLEVNPADAEFLPMDTVLEEDSEANMYTSDSVKRFSGIHYRPSVFMSLFNSNLGQSMRKRSMRKAESFREAQGHINPAFAINMEKCGPSRSTSLSKSRSSSIIKKNSPAHSRTSSMTFGHNSITKHRHKSYDLPSDNSILNCSAPECEGNAIASAMTTAMAPIVANFQDGMDNCVNDAESDSDIGQQTLDSYMPPIPEEPSRVASMVNMESELLEDEHSSSQEDDVQALVAEASKVLEELNRVVTTGGHNKRCDAKGYESCCSLRSDDSEEDSENELSEVDMEDNSDSISIDVPNARNDGDDKILNDVNIC